MSLFFTFLICVNLVVSLVIYSARQSDCVSERRPSYYIEKDPFKFLTLFGTFVSANSCLREEKLCCRWSVFPRSAKRENWLQAKHCDFTVNVRINLLSEITRKIDWARVHCIPTVCIRMHPRSRNLSRHKIFCSYYCEIHLWSYYSPAN